MRLVLRFNGQDVQEFVLDKKDITIGRVADNDIVVDSLATSSHHAIIHNMENGIVLEDMKSTNGTFVNDKKISEYVLQGGDVIGIGKHQIIFYTQIVEDQSEATVMMSADFQKQLQQELSKSQTSNHVISQKQIKEDTFFDKIKGLFGF
jgi:pSer/pThr/pTyr-binding forkhead associated (FHA) protein